MSHNIPRFAYDSRNFGVVFTKEEADRLHAGVIKECEQLWLPRDHPSVAFSIFGKTKAVRRDKAIMGDVSVDGTRSACYRYGSKHLATVHRWTPTVAEIRARVEEITGLNGLTHCVLNYYLDETDYIGMHSDKDRDFQPNYSIISVSFGATREITVQSIHDPAARTVLLAEHGSMYELNELTNRYYKHGVLQMKAATGARLGLTFRTVSSVYDTDTDVVEMHAVVERPITGTLNHTAADDGDEEKQLIPQTDRRISRRTIRGRPLITTPTIGSPHSGCSMCRAAL